MRALKSGHYELRPLDEFKVTRKLPPKRTYTLQPEYVAFSKEDQALLERIYPKIKK